MIRIFKIGFSLFSACLIFTGCNSVDDNRIPSMPVNIVIDNPGLWNTYGVSGFGVYRNFIYTSSLKLPLGFPYTSSSATGFGGVLLIEGMDPFSGDSSVPLAYDLACPVERQANVRIEIDPESYMAICPVCESVYDVTMQRGAPVAGMAATGNYKYGLRTYKCSGNPASGYIIAN